MKFRKVNDENFIAIVCENDLKDNNIDINVFMSNSIKTEDFINFLRNEIINYFSLSSDLILNNIFKYKNDFILYFTVIKSSIFRFHSINDFNDFCFAVKSSKYSDCLYIDEENKEISLLKTDYTNKLFNILKEFTY